MPAVSRAARSRASRPRVKTITATVNPGASQIVVAQQPTVGFIGDASTISAVLTTASASPAAGVIANGVALSTITVTVRDQNGNGVAGQAVSLAATGSNNTLVQPGLTNALGVASGTIASIAAETKVITATVNPGAGQVVVAQQPSVEFIPDASNISACCRRQSRRRPPV
jgi:adhesin/invasin